MYLHTDCFPSKLCSSIKPPFFHVGSVFSITCKSCMLHCNLIPFSSVCPCRFSDRSKEVFYLCQWLKIEGKFQSENCYSSSSWSMWKKTRKKKKWKARACFSSKDLAPGISVIKKLLERFNVAMKNCSVCFSSCLSKSLIIWVLKFVFLNFRYVINFKSQLLVNVMSKVERDNFKFQHIEYAGLRD